MKTNHTTNASLRKVLGLVPVAADRGWLSVEEGDDTAGGGGDGGEESLGDAGQGAIQKERRARKELDRQLREAMAKLKAVEGIDPTVYREATQKAQELEERNAELQSAADRARQEAEQTYSVQLQQASQRIRDVETRLQEQEMEYIGERLFLAAKGRAVVSEAGTSNFTMFWREARGHFARDEQGLYVVDRRAGDGKTPLIDSESGKRVDPSKYVAEVLAEDAVLMHLFEPKYGVGSGGQGGSAGRTITGVDMDSMSPTQLIGLGLKG